MKYQQKALKICIYVLVFGASIIGGQLFGVSLNKLCFLPLMVYLLLCSKQFVINKSLVSLMMFYFFGMLSSIVSLLAPYANYIEGYTTKSLLFSIQSVVLYIPMLFLLSSYPDKKTITNYSKDALVFTSRLNIVVAVVEFVSYFIVGTEFTDSILQVFYKVDYASARINLGGLGKFLRPTGLNLDPAYLGIIIVFAFIFEEKIIWKVLGVIVLICSMSRSSILILIALFGYKIIKGSHKKNIKKKYLVIPVVVAIVFFALVRIFPGFGNQIMGLLGRFNFSSEINDLGLGTIRHILYIPKSIEVYLFQYNLFQKLIGFGPRLSGTILAHANVMNEYLTSNMFSSAWTIECDIAELLLGYGLIGFILYFSNIFKLRHVPEYGDYLFFIIFLYSIMYDISASTLNQLIIMIFLSCSTSVE